MQDDTLNHVNPDVELGPSDEHLDEPAPDSQTELFPEGQSMLEEDSVGGETDKQATSTETDFTTEEKSRSSGAFSAVKNWCSIPPLFGFLYLSHFLSSWGDRLWAFAVPLIFIEIFPNSLFPATLFAFSSSLACFLLSPYIGSLADTLPRLFAVRLSLVIQNTAVVVAALFLYLILPYSTTEAIPWSATLICLFIILNLVGALAALADVASSICVEKDWTTVVSGGDQEALSQLNSTMRRIDLICDMVSPLVFGTFLDFSSAFAGLIMVVVWNVVSVVPEYFLLSAVYDRVPALHSRVIQLGVEEELDPFLTTVDPSSIELQSLQLGDHHDTADSTLDSTDDTLATSTPSHPNETETSPSQEATAVGAARRVGRGKDDDRNDHEEVRPQQDVFVETEETCDPAVMEDVDSSEKSDAGLAAHDRIDGSKQAIGESDLGLSSVASASASAVPVATSSSGTVPTSKQPFLALYHGWRMYFRHPVFFASLAYVLLYITVLSGGVQMTAYLASLGIANSAIAVFRAVASVSGILSTFLVPLLVRRLGVMNTGQLFLSWQAFCLVPAVAAFFFIPHQTLNLSIFLGGVVLSRCGLWGFDLAEVQIMQTLIDPSVLGLLNGTESALTKVAWLCMLGLGMVFPDPKQFGYLVGCSIVAILLALVSYSWFWVRNRRPVEVV
eukprot:CAMPEP_0174238264 /NCGR_PEP_ID=MMETSP0417-20130205/10713_1 /TAXON_ID=242541 /ORGANISM="Mayorella sp, Strain BSH-02190019" /LENGTH=671 /DNA_ID=CAMNT_0015317083 /DNA_START=130 /DNA_END=2145 /DNA_ORIENTATION=+